MSEVRYKTKAERVQEAVQILSKLKQLGIVISEPGYKMTKAALDTWIKDGEAQEEQEIPFPRHGRTAFMTLPSQHIKPSISVLKVSAIE